MKMVPELFHILIVIFFKKWNCYEKNGASTQFWQVSPRKNTPDIRPLPMLTCLYVFPYVSIRLRASGWQKKKREHLRQVTEEKKYPSWARRPHHAGFSLQFILGLRFYHAMLCFRSPSIHHNSISKEPLVTVTERRVKGTFSFFASSELHRWTGLGAKTWWALHKNRSMHCIPGVRCGIVFLLCFNGLYWW